MMQSKQFDSTGREIVGLVPAAGHAARIAPLPCSKELYPVGFQSLNGSGESRSKVVSQFLLERMHHAGVRKAYIIVRAGKLDIPAYHGDGSRVGLNLAYLMMRLPFGVPFTLDQAYSFCRESLVVLGFPDIIFKPADAFDQLISRQEETGADVVLGLYPTDHKEESDMVAIDSKNRVRGIVVKPIASDLIYAWIVGVWTPVFTEFMHEFIQLREYDLTQKAASGDQAELYLGEVFQEAISKGLRIESVPFPNHSFLDIGTPESLVETVRRLNVATPS